MADTAPARHWLTLFDGNEPYGSLCECKLGRDHDETGALIDADPIEDELAAAQQAYLAAPIRRRAAVRAARKDVWAEGWRDGWSQYRIAKLWGVHHNTVAKIVEVLEREERDTRQSGT